MMLGKIRAALSFSEFFLLAHYRHPRLAENLLARNSHLLPGPLDVMMVDGLLMHLDTKTGHCLSDQVY